MHSFLITGGSENSREEKILELVRSWGVIPYDCTYLQKKDDKEEIGIADVRLFERELAYSPRSSPYHVGIIKKAHILTVPSQQALLKTLEEPPSKVKIIMESENPDSLLTTILSRMTAIRLPHEAHTEKNISDWTNALAHKNPGEILCFVDTHIQSRADAIAFLTDFLYALHNQFIVSKNVSLGLIIRSILTAQNRLSANVNYKLVLDDFLFFYTRQAPYNPVK